MIHKAILFTVLSLALAAGAFLSAEFYLRHLEKGQFGAIRNDAHAMFDSEIGWVPIPNHIVQNNTTKITTNAFGFRSGDIDDEKNQVIIIGDSVAWGYRVQDEETMPYFLNERLNPEGYQVFNLAVPGYGIGQSYLYLKRHIGLFKNLKHIVLVICTYNDVANTGNNVTYGVRKPLFEIGENNTVSNPMPIFKYCWANIFGASELIRNVQNRWPGLSKVMDRFAGTKKLETPRAREISLMLIDRIHDLARENGSELTLVLSPEREDFIHKSEDLSWFEESFKTRDPYPAIDFYQDLNSSGSTMEQLYLDYTHFTPLGNKLLAEIISNRTMPQV